MILTLSLVSVSASLAWAQAPAGTGKTNKSAGRGAKTPAKTDGKATPATVPSGAGPASTDAPANAVPASEIEGAKTEANVQAGTSQVDGVVKMRGLEEKVNDLKEKIFRSKARLLLLRETVLAGAIGGAKAVIVHQNDLGSNFVLENASYSLDGAPLFSKVDSGGDLSDKKTIEIFSGNIVPGNHNLSMSLVYRLEGFGVFSYAKGYGVKVRSSYAFTAEEGKTVTLRAVSYEKGGITTNVQDRPAVRFEFSAQAAEPSADEQKAGEAAAAPASSP